jgi:hypothetical protein
MTENLAVPPCIPGGLGRLPLAARLGGCLKIVNRRGHWEHGDLMIRLSIRVTANFEGPLDPVFPVFPVVSLVLRQSACHA